MKRNFKNFTLIAIIILTLFRIFETKAQDFSQITLAGTGYSLPFYNHPVNNVNVFSKPDNTFLGSTTTNSVNGNYTISFFPVGEQEHNYKKEEMKVLGNPVATTANLELVVLNQNNYTIRVFDGSGKELYNQKVSLSDGNNRITLSGLGSAGIKFVNVTNGEQSYTSKVIQTENTFFSPSISATATTSQNGQLKMSLEQLITDSLYVQFDPVEPNYTGMDTTIVVGTNLNLNYVDEQIPTYVINTTFKPFDVNGNPANITLTIHWPNVTGPDSVKYYTPNASNEIPIQQNLYTTNAVATIELDSVSFVNNQQFLGWIIGRKIHQPREDSNLFQNPKEWTDQFPQPVTVDMSNPDINGKTIYTYVVNKYAHKDMNSGTPGDSIRMDAQPVREMMIGRSGGVTHKFIDVNVESLLPFYKIQYTFNPDNGQQVPVTQLDRAKTLSEMTDTLSYIPNTGDTLMPQHVFHRAASLSDPILVQCQGRGSDGGDQYTRITFANQFPGNVVIYKNNYTYNNTVRESWSYAEDDVGDPDGTIFTEYFDSMTALADPTVTTAGAFIWSEQNHTSSDLGKKMLRTIYLLNLNTKY